MVPAQEEKADQVNMIDQVLDLDAFAIVPAAHRTSQVQSGAGRCREMRKVPHTQSDFRPAETNLRSLAIILHQLEHALVGMTR